MCNKTGDINIWCANTMLQTFLLIDISERSLKCFKNRVLAVVTCTLKFELLLRCYM
jgi:hypothetical protein